MKFLPSRRQTLLPKEVLNQFKEEIAQELGIADKVKQVGWAEMPSRECGRVGGKIGGNMVKVLIRNAQKSLMQE